MPVAALDDIHGNLPALRAVLAAARHEGVETFVIGGDVAAGPLPREALYAGLAHPQLVGEAPAGGRRSSGAV